MSHKSKLANYYMAYIYSPLRVLQQVWPTFQTVEGGEAEGRGGNASNRRLEASVPATSP